MTPHEFAQRLNRLYAGTMMQDMEMLHAGEGRARGRVAFKPHLRQLTGLLSCWSDNWARGYDGNSGRDVGGQLRSGA